MSPTTRRRPGVGTRIAALAALLAVAAGCGGEPERPRRPRGSAVWVDPAIAPLTPEARRTLQAAGVEEVFLEAATLRWEGGQARLEEIPSAFEGAVPPGLPVTLVVRGAGPPDEVDPPTAEEGMTRGLRGLRHRAERSGLLPVGFHFDFTADPDPEASAALLGALRRASGSGLLLSTSLRPERAGEREGRALAGAVDYVVAFLYGQAPGAPDDREAWDPGLAAERVEALEALGRDYVVGLHVLGRADHLGPAGDLRTTTTRAVLESLAEDPALRLSIDDPFAGVGRLVHTFQAQGASRAAGWRVAPGERIRVTRTAPALLRDFVGRVEAARLRHHAGFVFHRLAAPEEALSLTPAELAASLGAVSPLPDLRWRLVVQSQARDSTVLQIELLNRSRQRTDLAATDGNYLEVRAEGGYFERVAPGDFARYTLWRGDREARPGTGWREPDRVRLHTRMVGAEERIGGATLTLRARGGAPAVYVSGRFFLPDGSELEIPPEGGSLEPSREGPSEARD